MVAPSGKGLPEEVKKGFKFNKPSAPAEEVQEVPAEQPAAVEAASGSGTSVITSLPQVSNSLINQSENTVIMQSQAKRTNKTDLRERATFYLDLEQAQKLDEMILAYRKQTGKRVNRNEIVRYLLDACDVVQVINGLERAENEQR